MYEELIETLQEYPDREENADGYIEIDWQDLLDAADTIKSLTGQLADLQSENESKDKEIERLQAALSRVEAERDAAKKCIYDIETYLALGAAQYIGRTIQVWKRGAQGEA